MKIRTPFALALTLLAPLALSACPDDPADEQPMEAADPECGNGLLEDGETCEGNPPPQGCDASTCTVMAGYECSPPPPDAPEPEPTGDGEPVEPPMWTSTCSLLPVCGNGVVEDGEACDDMDTAPGDGCDADCQIEDGFSCAGEPSDCAACGDGFVDPGEACDDGYNIGSNSPGCTDTCEIVDGWECFNEPSMCGPVCGDGMLFDTNIEGITQGSKEDCDDGNTEDGDGCSSSCDVEDGCDCSGPAGGLSTCECGLADSGTDTGTGSDSGTDSGSDSGTDSGTGSGTDSGSGSGSSTGMGA